MTFEEAFCVNTSNSFGGTLLKVFKKFYGAFSSYTLHILRKLLANF